MHGSTAGHTSGLGLSPHEKTVVSVPWEMKVFSQNPFWEFGLRMSPEG